MAIKSLPWSSTSLRSDVGHRTALLVLNLADAISLVHVLTQGHGTATAMKPFVSRPRRVGQNIIVCYI
ncbi:hypothetical protein Zm00014a_010561 [Zea mays]|uniref:Uncharacterized protein n=1 Tax=Zea mays TaxID=4577 RepID=A0A317YFI6_MAIZE|nr:hypothetical protein Zm00014a_010561 [Zea mays]